MLSPSLLGGELVLAGETLGERADHARAHGAAVHRACSSTYLAGPGRARGAGRRAAADPATGVAGAADEAARVLAAPGLAVVFDPAGLAEVDVSAPVPGRDDLRIVGRIDRLVVARARVLAVDFKSNRWSRAPPRGCPRDILRQLGAYRAALVPLWPDRPVEVAVLWTRAARLRRAGGAGGRGLRRGAALTCRGAP